MKYVNTLQALVICVLQKLVVSIAENFTKLPQNTQVCCKNIGYLYKEYAIFTFIFNYLHSKLPICLISCLKGLLHNSFVLIQSPSPIITHYLSSSSITHSLLNVLPLYYSLLKSLPLTSFIYLNSSSLPPLYIYIPPPYLLY